MALAFPVDSKNKIDSLAAEIKISPNLSTEDKLEQLLRTDNQGILQHSLNLLHSLFRDEKKPSQGCVGKALIESIKCNQND
jgi:hypothetical protein